MRWSEMTPRQRDAALAEKQGWTDVHLDESWSDLDEYVGCLPDSCLVYSRHVPYFTTDDAAALELAKWIRKQRYVTIILKPDSENRHAFYCEVSAMENYSGAVASADTLAAAISETVWVARGGER